jgi:hypothetical protein
MSLSDLKVAFFNAISLSVSFTQVENGLKIMLLVASIVYTLQKIYSNHKKNDEKL